MEKRNADSERAALLAAFGAAEVPPGLLRPDAIRAARTLWRYGIPEHRVAELLHLTVPAVREMLTARNGPAMDFTGSRRHTREIL